MNTKEIFDEISFIPPQVKIAAFVIAFILGIGIVLLATGNYRLNRQVEKLETANIELEKRIEAEKAKAIKAETLAAEYRIKAENLESQLPKLETKGKSQDADIINQKQNSNAVRNSISDIKRRKYEPRPNANANSAANSNADDSDVKRYQEELKRRYGGNSNDYERNF